MAQYSNKYLVGLKDIIAKIYNNKAFTNNEIGLLHYRLSEYPEKYSENDKFEEILDCYCKYISIVIKYSEITNCQSHKLFRINILKYMSGVAEIRLIPELVNKFAEEITVPILENITDPSIKIVCAKELIRSYNIIVASSEKSVREKLANTSRLYLFKLADLLCSCGDYEYQTCLVETIFRICPIDFIKAYASEFFPGTESLQQALIKFDVKNFDNSVRIFLRLVNNIFGNVYSFVADDILLDNVNIIPPTDSQGQKVELWIDCNRTSGTIGIYCDQYCLRNDSLSQISDGKGWELITIFADDIYLVDVKKPKDTLETEKLPTLFKFTLANEFHVQYPASESITKSKYLKVIVHDERIIEKLQKSVFPIMFKEKFQGGENKKSRMSDTLSLKPKTNSLKKRYNALCVRVKSQSIVSADTRSMKSLDDVMRVKNSKNIFVGAECISPSSTNLDVFIDNDMQIPETQYFSANEELDNDKNTKQEMKTSPQSVSSMGTKRISPNSTNLDVSFGNDIQIPETQYFSVDTELDNDKNTKQKVPVIEMSKIYQSCPIRNCNKKPLKKERVKVKFPFIRKQVPTRKKSFDPAFSPIYEGAESTRLEQNDSLSKSSYANQIKTDETETPEIITTPLRANRSKTKEQRYRRGQQFKPTPQSETIGDETVVKTSQSNILTTTEINHILNDSENHSDRKQGISKENNAQFEAALHGTSRFTEEIIEQQSQENLNQRNSEVVIHERNNKICKSEIFEDACEYFTSLWDEFPDTVKESELKELRNVQEELASNNKTNSSSTNYKSSESVEKLTVVGENIHESLDKNRSQNAVKNSQEGENILKEPVGDSIIAKELGNSQIDNIIEKNEKIESIMNSQKLQRPEIIADGFEKNNTEKANKKRHHQMQKTKSRMVEKPLRKETYEYRQDIPTCNPVEICTVKGSSDESLLKEKQSVKLYDKKQFSVAGDSVETKDISTTSKMIVQQTPNESKVELEVKMQNLNSSQKSYSLPIVHQQTNDSLDAERNSKKLTQSDESTFVDEHLLQTMSRKKQKDVIILNPLEAKDANITLNDDKSFIKNEKVVAVNFNEERKTKYSEKSDSDMSSQIISGTNTFQIKKKKKIRSQKIRSQTSGKVNDVIDVESHTKEGVIQGTSTCATTQIIANTNLVSNVALDNLEELVTVETQHAKADTVLSQKESIKVNLEVPQRVKDVEKYLKSNNSKEFVENKSVKGLELRKSNRKRKSLYTPDLDDVKNTKNKRTEKETETVDNVQQKTRRKQYNYAAIKKDHNNKYENISNPEISMHSEDIKQTRGRRKKRSLESDKQKSISLNESNNDAVKVFKEIQNITCKNSSLELAIDDSGNMQNNEDKELAVNNSGNMKNNENKNIGSGKMKNIKSLKKNKRGTNTHELKRDQEDSETKFANKNVQLGSVIENVQRRTNGKPKRGLDANKNRNVLSVAESDNSILHDEEDVLLKSTLNLTQKQLIETEVLIKEETSVSVICNDDKKDSIQNIDTITTNTDLLEKGNTKINEKHEESGKVSSTPNQNVLSQKFDVNTEIIISSSQKSKSSTIKRKLSQSDTKLFVKKSKRFKLYDPNDFSYLENDESLNKDLTAIPQFEAKSTPNETLADLRKKKRQRSNKKKPKQKAKSRTQQVKKTSRPDRNSDILSNERDVSYQFDKIAQQEFSRKNYEKRTISSSSSSESDDGSPKRIQVVAMVHPIREHTDNNRSRVNGDKNIQKARQSIGDIQIENKKDSKLKQISTTSKQQTRKRNVSLDEGSTKLGRRQKELFDTFLKSFVEDINKTRISVREIHNSSKLARLRREKKQVKKPTKKRRLSSDDDFLINDNQLHHRKGQVKVNILENIVLKAANEEQYNECAEFEELPEAIESSLDTVNGDSVSEGRHSEIMWREMFKIFLLIKNVLIKYPPHNMKQNKYYEKLLKDILDVWKVVANNK